MLSIWQAAFLGVLQGLTEFLPVSSSGHLVVLQQIFGWNEADHVIMAFDVALHVGTLIAVVAYFWQDVWKMLTGKNMKMLGYLIVATIPAVVIGLALKDTIEKLFTSVAVVGVAWLVTGTFLWLTKYVKESKYTDVGWLRSLFVGLAQAIAIIPGVSRSGSTIVTGMFLKLDKVLAARFAFLMSIPAIGGGALLDSKNLIGFPAKEIPSLIVGVIISAVVGYLAIYWLLKIIQRGRFQWFGVYCWSIGAATLIVMFT